MEDINKKNMEIYRKGAIKRMAKFNTSELDFTIIVRSSRPSIRVVGEGCVCTIIINEVHYDKNKDVFTLKYETYNTRSKINYMKMTFLILCVILYLMKC